jgi:hypothetical protein
VAHAGVRAQARWRVRALQWKPNDDVQTSLTYFRSQHKFHWDENAIFTAAIPTESAG